MAPSRRCSRSRGRGTGFSRSRGRLSLVRMSSVVSDTVAITFLPVGIIPYLGRTQQGEPYCQRQPGDRYCPEAAQMGMYSAKHMIRLSDGIDFGNLALASYLLAQNHRQEHPVRSCVYRVTDLRRLIPKLPRQPVCPGADRLPIPYVSCWLCTGKDTEGEAKLFWGVLAAHNLDGDRLEPGVFC